MISRLNQLVLVGFVITSLLLSRQKKKTSFKFTFWGFPPSLLQNDVNDMFFFVFFFKFLFFLFFSLVVLFFLVRTMPCFFSSFGVVRVFSVERLKGCLGFRVQGSGFRVQVLKVLETGSRLWDFRFFFFFSSVWFLV